MSVHNSANSTTQPSATLTSGCNSMDGNINGNNPNPTVNDNNTSPGHQNTSQSKLYSIPGILHFIQCEWQRFENERYQWEIEKSELNARIALLQGERKGQENLKSDLVRRIKMLEYCLRQERAKFHQLKYGVDAPTVDNIPVDKGIINSDGVNDANSGASCDIGNNPDTGADGANWMLGRQLLRQYLQEIGYTDSIIDVRSSRVRSLLGLINMRGSEDNEGEINKANQDTDKQQTRRKNHASPAMHVVSDAESAVLATFEFLDDSVRPQSNANYDQITEDSQEVGEADDRGVLQSLRTTTSIDSETENVLAEFDFLSPQRTTKEDMSCWRSPNSSKDMVDIGDLADLTVTNESLDVNGSSMSPDELQTILTNEQRKTWNPRYTLKSHFDCVRSLRFHSEEALLVTCSEDQTIKLWNISKTTQLSNKGKQQGSQGSTTFDLEPVYTYRGHTSRVLSLAVNYHVIYSGAKNGELFTWFIPTNIANIDPYDTYNSRLMGSSLSGHTDAIWSIVPLQNTPSGDLICSASADCTIKIWSSSTKQCLKNITWEDENVRPTCLASALPTLSVENSSSSNLLAASFTDGTISIYDVESSNINQPVLVLKSEDSSRINSITVHPTMPIMVSAQDRQIKFWDINSGKCVHEMRIHLEEVTCVAFDPNGLHLLTGSHDCSVRLWNYDTHTCVQEISSHRKKFDEGIFDVTFHPTKPYFASAGADGLVKVYV